MIDGRYRVVGCIGAGGMGMVYEGVHLGLRRRVALKVLRPELCQQPRAVERFLREAQAACAIAHENVVQVFDTGQLRDGTAYYVMEFLEGEDLATTLEAVGSLPWPRVRHFALQICAALSAVHDLGIIHRDLKPENCFRVTRGGDPDFIKVLDFGIAKGGAGEDGPSQALTRTGELVGTTPYMAPEQAAGESIDLRIDVYAVGVIMYQLLAGRLPFVGANANQVLAAILTLEAPPLRALVGPEALLSAEAEAVVVRAMHKNRALRFPDAASLAAALRAVPEPATASPAATDVGIDAWAATMAAGTAGLAVRGVAVLGAAGKVGAAEPVARAGAIREGGEGASIAVAGAAVTRSVPVGEAEPRVVTAGASESGAAGGVSERGGAGKGLRTEAGGGAGPRAAERAAPWRLAVGAVGALLAGGGLWWSSRAPAEESGGAVVLEAASSPVPEVGGRSLEEETEGMEVGATTGSEAMGGTSVIEGNTWVGSTGEAPPTSAVPSQMKPRASDRRKGSMSSVVQKLIKDACEPKIDYRGESIAVEITNGTLVKLDSTDNWQKGDSFVRCAQEAVKGSNQLTKAGVSFKADKMEFKRKS